MKEKDEIETVSGLAIRCEDPADLEAITKKAECFQVLREGPAKSLHQIQKSTRRVYKKNTLTGYISPFFDANTISTWRVSLAFAEI